MIKIENEELDALREITATILENADRGWGESNPEDLDVIEKLDTRACNALFAVNLTPQDVRVLKSALELEWGDFITNYHGFVSLQEKVDASR